MDNLDKLFANSELRCSNEVCNGCSILNSDKPAHSIMDYESKSQSDILFLSDSLNYKFGSAKAFNAQELALIEESCKEKFETAASVKCPSVREADMKTADFHKCRNHLEQTILKIRPKLVFTCGNLAMKMLIKKSGINSKRGNAYEYEIEDHKCVVVPIYHPFSVIKEPRFKHLFQKDISNGLDTYIYGNTNKLELKYDLLMTLEDVKACRRILKDTDKTLAADVETTGLDFTRHKITTVSLTTHDNTWVIPIDHKDSPFKDDLGGVLDCLRDILQNPKNKKVMHNAKFDLKFFYKYGIEPVNVYDTKLMYHTLDENSPKGLMDLVKIYFPHELSRL